MAMSKAVKTVADWKMMVYRYRGTPRINEGARVLLLLLADHMRANLQVSVPQTKLATELGIDIRRVKERVQAAKAAGLLDTVVSGQPGRTAVYVGTFPDVGRIHAPQEQRVVVRTTAPSKGAHMRPTNPPIYGADIAPPISKHSLTEVLEPTSPRGQEENPQQRTSERANESDRRPDLPRRSERSDAAERSEDVPAWAATVHDGWCLSGCGTYLNTREGQATGYCSQHRKDNAA